jgi:hypothetical protein
LIDFIDTTKEGTKAAQSRYGRKKMLKYNFVGTATKSIKPGEIGEFTVVMSYPPGANTVSGAPGTSASTTASTA